MALVLLIVSGLMIRTFASMQQVETAGLAADLKEVQTFRVEVPEALIGDRVQMARTHDQIAQKLREVPGVVSVGMSSHITMDGGDNTNPLIVDHVSVPEGQLPPFSPLQIRRPPGFFETMGNPP